MPSLLQPQQPEPLKPQTPDTLWQQWKTTPTPDNGAALLSAIEPDIDKALRAHVARPTPLMRSKARELSLQALRTYDPARGTKMSSHIYSHMQGLRRYAGKVTAGVRVPERLLLDRNAVQSATADLADRLGRDPTDDELADHTGLSMRRLAAIRRYHSPMTTGYMSQVGESGEGLDPASRLPNAPAMSRAWLNLVYDELGPLDKKVLEYSLGYGGNPVLPVQVIAAKLRRSPGWVSQRTKLIQEKLDQEQHLSPFGV